jgi:hypothetical protein
VILLSAGPCGNHARPRLKINKNKMLSLDTCGCQPKPRLPLHPIAGMVYRPAS